MLRHWLSVTILLIPVMTFGWLIASVFIWKLVPTLRWIEALVLAACVTATDPVLASAVVGKGKFAQRVPGHLRNLLSAESGSNDGMAFPFAYLALSCILHEGHTRTIAFHFIVITVLYECIFGCVLGAVIGYTGRHLIKFAEKHNLIDRESFLVFYFVLALFCTGVGSIIGVDDLLVAFAAGCAFSWDGWFSHKTEESHVSDVIDILLNMAYFVYFGAIVPWQQFEAPEIGIRAWKLVIIAILIILFRRIPIMLALKPVIPDIKTWREALFCGHFGPIGVGAVFMSILSRAELEHEEPTPLAVLPGEEHPHYYVVACIWPVVTFLIIASIVVHGSSIAVFTLGKRLNNLTITMTYTTAGSQNQGWLSRLSRVESRTFSLQKVDTENPDFPVIAPSTNPEKPGISSHPKKQHKRHHARRRRNGDEPPAAIALDLGGGGNTHLTAAGANAAPDLGVINQDPSSLTVGEKNSTSIATTEEPFGASSGSSSHSPQSSTNETQVIHTGITAAATGPDGKPIPQIHLTADEISPELREKLAIDNSSTSVPTGPITPGQQQQQVNAAAQKISAYQLGDTLVLEDQEGEVLTTVRSNLSNMSNNSISSAKKPTAETVSSTGPSLMPPSFQKQNTSSHVVVAPPPPVPHPGRHGSASGPSPRRRMSSVSGSARHGGVAAGNHHESRKVTAYQLDDNIIVENEEGEIIRRFHINYKDGDIDPNSAPGTGAAGVSGQGLSHTSTATSSHHSATGMISHGIDRTLTHFGIRRRSTIGGAGANIDLEKHADGSSGSAYGGAGAASTSGGYGGTTAAGAGPSSGLPAGSKSRYPLDDERMRKHLKQLLINDPKVNPDYDMRNQAVQEEDDEDGSSSGSDSYSSDEDVSPTATRRSQVTSSSTPQQPKQVQQQPQVQIPAHRIPTATPTPAATTATTSPGLSSNIERIQHPSKPVVQDDEDDETEVERQRRLAALGIIQTEDDDDSPTHRRRI